MEPETIIPYGTAEALDASPQLRLRRGEPLRLSDGPYPFAEPPDLFRLGGVAAQLAFLREQLEGLCGLWDKRARLFLAAYFARIDAAIAAGRETLAARAGGLFAPEDWSFAALRPLPQAHLADAEGGRVRVDFAFWTGAQPVAIELPGTGTPRRQRRVELERLAAAGTRIVTLGSAELEAEGEACLARALPAEFQDFWQGIDLPASPFAPAALDEIRWPGTAS